MYSLTTWWGFLLVRSQKVVLFVFPSKSVHQRIQDEVKDEEDDEDDDINEDISRSCRLCKLIQFVEAEVEAALQRHLVMSANDYEQGCMQQGNNGTQGSFCSS